MMTFYAAAGSYQIRNEDGKDMPYIIMALGYASFIGRYQQRLYETYQTLSL